MIGRLIVIEGSDGSGKTEQWKLLANHFKKENYNVELVDFPQYSKVSSGLINNYLRGIYGKPEKVSPYAASLFYALDRYDLSFKIHEWLKKGKIILANRYVASNGGHQGGKIKDSRKRIDFFKWLYEIEYNILNIPKPTINIFLDVPIKISQQLIEKRGLPKDEHERSVEHVKNAYSSYHVLIRQFPKDFLIINCMRAGKLRTRKDIHDEIWRKLNLR